MVYLFHMVNQHLKRSLDTEALEHKHLLARWWCYLLHFHDAYSAGTLAKNLVSHVCHAVTMTHRLGILFCHLLLLLVFELFVLQFFFCFTEITAVIFGAVSRVCLSRIV